MTDNLENKGPGISAAQKIGDDARAALYANKPEQWILGEEPGDDFGYDFSAIAFGGADNSGQLAFKIQLKGTTQAIARSANGLHLAYSFNRTTLNLWHNSLIAVVVIIADLIDTRDPKSAKVYWYLANPELDVRLPNLLPDQKSITLHVPINQEVHRGLDILESLKQYLDDLKEAIQLTRERRQASGKGMTDVISHGAMHAGMTTSTEGAAAGEAIEALIKLVPRTIELTAALNALRSGNYDRVLSLAPPPTLEEIKNEPQQSAVCAYLRYRVMQSIGDPLAGIEMLDLAASLQPHNDDIVAAVAQRKLDVTDFGTDGYAARQAILDSLKSDGGISASSIKAKIYSLNHDFDAARDVLRPFQPDKTATSKIIVSIIERDWERVLVEVTESRTLSMLLESQHLFLRVFEARAYFELALSGVRRPEDAEFIVPSTGLPGIDYEQLRKAYTASIQAMQVAQRLNWPADIQYLLDVFIISSMVLGDTDDALPLLSSLGFSRPNIAAIREVITKYFVQIGRPELAIQIGDLAGDSPKFEDEVVVMAAACNKAGNNTKALSYVTDDFLDSSSSSDTYLSTLLALGILADSSLRSDLFAKIRNRLDRDSYSRHFLAILESAALVSGSLLRRHEALCGLYKYWIEHGEPAVVGYNILGNSDPTDTDAAKLILEVAERLESDNSLGADHEACIAQALLTLSRAEEATIRLKKACERFHDEPRLQSLLGIGLELIGKSAEAFEIIGQLLDSGTATETARRYYVEIAARIGFFDRAEEQVRAAYVKATTKSQRLRHLNTLFQLLQAEGTRPLELEDVAWEYGKLANQGNEREEGIFLQEYLFATLPSNADRNPERLTEFRLRLDTYTQKFPNSKFLWRAEIPVEGPPEAVIAALQEAAGVTDRNIAEAKATERKMDQGALHIPFSWRPKRFLLNISDVFMLWKVGKTAPLERAAFHFSNSACGFKRNSPTNLAELETVFSLTSLLLLNEIGLLSLALDAFDRIIVARSTLIALQEARGRLSGGWGYSPATEILKELQERFSKISHPPYQPENSKKYSPDWHEEELAAMRPSGRLYFCDDIIEAALVCGLEESSELKPSISVVEFLVWAEQSKNVITPKAVADAMAGMARLKIAGVEIQNRYIVAAIPDSLQSAATLAQETEAEKEATSLNSILDGLWDSSRPFNDLRNHFAQLMSYLLNEGHASEAVLVLLWLRLLQSVRFQVDPKGPPLLKISVVFISTLRLIDADKRVAQRLWQSFFTTIKRGLGGTLTEAEDLSGTKSIGALLGRGIPSERNASIAGALFDKARLGLEEGSSLYEIFNNSFVDSAAMQVKADMQNNG